MMEWNWTKREPSGSMIVVEGLGLIEIYRDKGGRCVDINGRRAWSCWRDSERGIQTAMRRMVAEWNYLNSFIQRVDNRR